METGYDSGIMQYSAILSKLHAIDREHRRLERISALLQWDQETFLPPEGVAERAEQLALIEGIAHRCLTAPETGKLLADAGSTAGSPRGDESLQAADRDFLRVMRRKYDRAARLPPDFVSKSARAEGLSQAAWAEARMKKDFSIFLPHLSTMIDTARQKAKYFKEGIGEKASLYDCLLDIYEPGMGEAEIGPLFASLRGRLSPLLRRIQNSAPPDTSFLKQPFPAERQAAFNRKLLDCLGFDHRWGRLDISAHPFTTTLGPDDVRITTRYFEDNALSGLFSVIHETGHAMYEMGFPPELRAEDSCLADGASMAVHESQSRFWENVIGRSLPFWECLFPLLREYFPVQLADVTADQFYRAVNEVKPSFIRVDADEVSYGLHIIFRFELEQRLISGDLDPARIPQAWHEKTKEYLGLDNEALGISSGELALQDIHWSMGSFGYFPSYLLGNLYGSQFSRKMNGDIPNFAGLAAGGKFGMIREWLRDNVYRWGCRLEPSELLQKVTGEKLQAEPFMDYIENKYSGIYSLIR